jgi:hypothetical protein
LATFTAAWFNVYLDKQLEPEFPKSYWHDLIYNKSNPSSLCEYANMTECVLQESRAPSQL